MRSPNGYRTARHPIAFVAVVHTLDSVTFAATAGTRAALVERVAEYVSCVAEERLLPADALQVRELLDAAEMDRAIECYFALVGGRWDEEWLITAAIEGGVHPTAIAHVDTIVPAGRTALAS